AGERCLRTTLHQIGFEFCRDRRGHRDPVIRLVDAPAGKHEFARHEDDLVMPLADQHLWRGGVAIDQDHRRRVDRPPIRMMVGFFLFLFDARCFGHFYSSHISLSSFRDAPSWAQARNPYSRWWLWIPGSRALCKIDVVNFA